MFDKYTNGVFISAAEDNGSTKLRKISLLIQGSNSYHEFQIIRLVKTEKKDSHGKAIYNLIKTVEYAYDGIFLVRKYCNSYNKRVLGNTSFDKFYLNQNPHEEMYETYNNGPLLGYNTDSGTYSIEIRSNYMYLNYRRSGISHKFPALELMFVPSV